MQKRFVLIGLLLSSLLGHSTPEIFSPFITQIRSSADKTDRLLNQVRNRPDSSLICQGRLTLESGIPVSTTDQSAKSTLYFTPYLGTRISLYDGTKWKLYAFSETSIVLAALTSDKNYDVWMYDNAGTPALELLVWSTDSTRATALTTQDGVYVKTGATTRRYLGTIRTTSTTTTEDSVSKRFVWNYYNRVPRYMKVVDTTDSWTYNSSVIRDANNSSSNRVHFVYGVIENHLNANIIAIAGTGNATPVVSNVSFYINASGYSDSYAVIPGYVDDVQRQQIWARFMRTTFLGYNYLTWKERGDASVTTFYGDDAGDDRVQSGMLAYIFN